MKKIGMIAVLLSAAIVGAWAQETNAPAPAEVKKFTPKVTVSGYSRLHYDVTMKSNANTQEWGGLSFYNLALKVNGEPVENFKYEISSDLGSLAGQRAITPSFSIFSKDTAPIDVVASALITTAYAKYAVMPELEVSAGRMYDYFSPQIKNIYVRDGVAVSGKVNGGLLKYGIMMANDSMYYSKFAPMFGVLLGTSPVKGISLDLACDYAAQTMTPTNGNPATNTRQLLYSANLNIKKWDVLPALTVLIEYDGSTVLSNYNDTNTSFNTLYLYGMVGYSIDNIMPFIDFYIQDDNMTENVAKDRYNLRGAVRWDVNPNFAVIPYIGYDFWKDGNVIPDALTFRVRVDAKF